METIKTQIEKDTNKAAIADTYYLSYFALILRIIWRRVTTILTLPGLLVLCFLLSFALIHAKFRTRVIELAMQVMMIGALSSCAKKEIEKKLFFLRIAAGLISVPFYLYLCHRF